MSNIFMNLGTLCNLRRRQQSFEVPPIRTTILSPYPTYTQDQLNMRRKVEILQYPNNKLNSRTNNSTKKEQYSRIISGKHQPKSYTTTYQNVIGYSHDPIFDLSSVVIERIPVFSNPDCPLDDLIYTPTSSSDVPGPIIDLYKDNNVPLYNYANTSENNIYGIINQIDPDLWKIKYCSDNTESINSIKTNDFGSYITLSQDTNLLSVYLTNQINVSSNIYKMHVPIGFYFYGKYKGTNPIELNNIHLTIPSTGFNPQVLFVENTLFTNRVVKFHENVENISQITFNVPNEGKDFSGSLYAGMLEITNIELFTEPGYIYDLNIITYITLIDDEWKLMTESYDFYYGLYYNITDANKKIENGCTINTNYSTNPLLPIRFYSEY